MNQQEPIIIVCASNNVYAVLLVVLIKSIEKNNTSRRQIIFYIIDDNINKKNKLKIENSINNPLIKLNWIPLDEKLLSNIKFPNDYSTYPKNIYSRLLIHHFLPESIDKVIYFDSDMMVNADVAELWNTDLGNNIVGAVQEPNVKTMDCHWSGVKNYEELGIPAKAKYFNSGLLLVDMKKWRQENIAQKVVDCVEKNKKYAAQPDQYGLNVVLCNKWKELDSEWNFYSNFPSEKLPKNVHFVIRKPIFTYYNGLESYREVFYKYLDDTEYKGFKPIGEIKRKLIKINNILEKVF